MDEERAVGYYNQHLLADLFGQWVSWWLLARKHTFDEDKMAVDHCVLRQKENVVYKLKLGAYLRNKKIFAAVLGLAMGEILRKKRGLRGFAAFVVKRLTNPNYLVEPEQLQHTKYYNERRLFQRLKQKTMIRLKLSTAGKDQLNCAGSTKLKILAQKAMDKLLVLASVQTKYRQLVQESNLHHSTWAKRSSLRKLLCCNMGLLAF